MPVKRPSTFLWPERASKPSSPLTLPRVPRESLNVQPADDRGLPQRYLNHGELDVLIALMRLCFVPVMAVEFGVNAGRTAKVVLRSLSSLKHYVGIDVEPWHVPTLEMQRNEVPKEPGIHALDDPRFDLMISRRGSLDLGPADIGPADIIFIDGDHSHGVVAHDTTLAYAIVQPGGVIIWHDYNENKAIGVADVLHAQRKAGHDIKHVAGTWLAYERA